MAGLNHRRKEGIGRMNTQISFYSLSASDDGQGGNTIETESAIATAQNVWAEVQEITGYKRLQYAQLISGKPYKIRIRERSDIDNQSIIGIGVQRLTIMSLIKDRDFKGYQYIEAVEKES
jgi:SPP1 family predicted phage head-tail adaptor